MSSIDQRVVEMKLDNKQFESGVSSTMSALDKLKAALSFDGTKNGFTDLNKASSKLDLSHIGRSVDQIRDKFSAMSVTAIAALGAIGAKIAQFGIGQLGNMMQPLTEGFAEYELKMGSIQTIMANTARHGTQLSTVTDELQNLNEYADQTIYSFSDMTRNASLFTNAGIRIEDATSMIKGFSNAAAASGVSSGAAAGAAYQLTQAMNSGVVRLMDWRSLTNAGMGSKNMQEGLIQIADGMGMFNDETTSATAAGKDFNGSLESQWLTADVMSNYLKIMAGDMTDAEMAALGLSEVEITNLKRAADDALDAATKVRTFTQLMSTIKEGIGSGWAQSIELLVGDFDQATELFSGISDTLGGMISRQSDARNKMIKEFVDAGGRDDIIQGFKNLWDAAMAVITPIQKAFREIFPKKSGAELTKFSQGFERLTGYVKMGAEQIGRLAPILKIVFGAFKAGLTILQGIGQALIKVATFIGYVIAGIGFLVGALAQIIVKWTQWLLQTEEAQRIFAALKQIWDAVGDTINDLGKRIQKFGDMVSKAFIALSEGMNVEAFTLLKSALQSLGIDGRKAADVAQNIVSWFKRMKEEAKNLVSSFSLDPIIDKLEDLADGFSALKEKMSFGKSINTKGIGDAVSKTDQLRGAWEGFFGFLGGIGGFLGKIIGNLGGFLGDAIKSVKGYLSTLSFQELLALVNTGFFIAMYAMIRTFIGNLNKVATGFSDVLGSMSNALENFGGKNPESIATKVLKIAIAIGILAVSAYALSTVDSQALGKALVAIGVMMAELAVTMKVMSGLEFGDDAKIIKAGIALSLMAIAVLILSKAVLTFQDLSWDQVAKGLVGVSTLLLALGLFTKFAEMGGGGIRAAIGLVIMALAIKLLGQSVEKFGMMDTKTLQKGLLVLGLLLAGLAAMSIVLSGAKLISAALGLLILNAALLALSYTLRFYAGLDFNELANGLGKVALVLLGVGIAARALPSNLPATAVGLILVAVALKLLIPALEQMGELPFGVIAQALIGLAISLGIIAAAMWVMSAPGTLAGAAALLIVIGALYLLLPVLIALGSLPIEILVLGLLAIAAVFVIFAAGGAALAPVIPVLILFAAVLAAIGLAMLLAGGAMALFGLGFGLMVTAIVTGGAVLVAFVQQLIMMLPLFAQQLGLALIAFAVVISDAGPAIVAAVTTVLLSILQAIQNITPELAATVATMILTMADTVSRLIPELAARALSMMLRFLQVVRQNVPAIVTEALLLMRDVLSTVADNIGPIVDEAMRMMTEFLAAVADNIGPIVDEATRLMVEFMNGIEENIPELVESGKNLVTTLIKEIAAAILGGAGDLLSAAKDLAGNIISGLTSGIAGGAKAVGNAVIGMGKSALGGLGNFLGINSPSRKFMEIGKYIDQGLVVGLNQHSSLVKTASENVGRTAIMAMQKSIGDISDILPDDVNLNPTIRPILDLSAVQADARKLDPLLSAKPISVETTRNSATSADTEYRSNRNAAEEISAQARETAAKVEFNQYNTSPKALDRVEIYRQTHNQLSLLKEEFNAASR